MNTLSEVENAAQKQIWWLEYTDPKNKEVRINLSNSGYFELKASQAGFDLTGTIIFIPVTYKVFLGHLDHRGELLTCKFSHGKCIELIKNLDSLYLDSKRLEFAQNDLAASQSAYISIRKLIQCFHSEGLGYLG